MPQQELSPAAHSSSSSSSSINRFHWCYLVVGLLSPFPAAESPNHLLLSPLLKETETRGPGGPPVSPDEDANDVSPSDLYAAATEIKGDRKETLLTTAKQKYL